MNNILILANGNDKKIISNIVENINNNCNEKNVIKIIVKSNNHPISDFVVLHHQNMQGDVCDFLWEAAQLNQDQPLIIASSLGFLHGMSDKIEENSVKIISSNIDDFKFDQNRCVCESANLTADVPYMIYFPETKLFVAAAESVIIQRKCEKNGGFSIKSVINSLILQAKNITVTTFC